MFFCGISIAASSDLKLFSDRFTFITEPSNVPTDAFGESFIGVKILCPKREASASVLGQGFAPDGCIERGTDDGLTPKKSTKHLKLTKGGSA
jgi:hypothetical protein